MNDVAAAKHNHAVTSHELEDKVFNKVKESLTGSESYSRPAHQEHRPVTTYSAVPELSDQTSSISAGMTVVGKISGEGAVKINGKVEGEIHAVNVVVSDGATVIGDINAQELTIGGRFKGNIHAARVTLKSTAIVEGEIFHQSLAIEENAKFEGVSRRESNTNDNSSRTAARESSASSHTSAFDADRSLNGSSTKDTFKESYVDRPLG